MQTKELTALSAIAFGNRRTKLRKELGYYRDREEFAMKLCASLVIATSLLPSTAVLAQHPDKCPRYDWSCQTLLPPTLPPQPLAPQAGYGPGRPHKCLRYDWTCQGGPIAPL